MLAVIAAAGVPAIDAAFLKKCPKNSAYPAASLSKLSLYPVPSNKLLGALSLCITSDKMLLKSHENTRRAMEVVAREVTARLYVVVARSLARQATALLGHFPGDIEPGMSLWRSSARLSARFEVFLGTWVGGEVDGHFKVFKSTYHWLNALTFS